MRTWSGGEASQPLAGDGFVERHSVLVDGLNHMAFDAEPPFASHAEEQAAASAKASIPFERLDGEVMPGFDGRKERRRGSGIRANGSFLMRKPSCKGRQAGKPRGLYAPGGSRLPLVPECK